MKVLILINEDQLQKDKLPAGRFFKLTEVLSNADMTAVIRCVETVSDLHKALREVRPQLVFSAAIHVRGKSGSLKNIHSLLEQRSVDYIGSTPHVLELVLDKPALKRCWFHTRIPTPSFLEVDSKLSDRLSAEVDALLPLRFPLIVKPTNQGNSRGITRSSVINDRHELVRHLAECKRAGQDVFLEQFLGNDPFLREFTVALIGEGSHPLLVPAEIIFKTAARPRVITTRDKEEHRTKAVPILDARLHARVVHLARKAFLAAGVRDYARCDILMTQGKLYAIEINGQPMVPDLWFERCAQTAGLDEQQYILAIFIAGLARIARFRKCDLSIPQGLKNALPPSIFKRLTRW